MARQRGSPVPWHLKALQLGVLIGDPLRVSMGYPLWVQGFSGFRALGLARFGFGLFRVQGFGLEG